MRTETIVATATTFDLAEYARKHRYRLRNLHDGSPVPPARRKRGTGPVTGFIGPADRWDGIVGYDGYVAMAEDRLSVFVAYKTARGVKRALAKLEAMEAQIDQVGDTEVGATVDVDRIEDVLKLIRVSKLPTGGDVSYLKHQNPDSPGVETVRTLESNG